MKKFASGGLGLFLAWYFAIYFTDCVMSTYFIKFMQHNGLTDAAIGAVTGLGSLLPLLVQPLWAAGADRARYKNSVLMLSTCGAAAAALPLLGVTASTAAVLIPGAYVLHACFRSPNTLLSDTITLERLENSGGVFGRVRLMGSVGWAVSGAAVGAVVGKRVENFAPAYLLSIGALIVMQLFLPRIKGHMKSRGGLFSGVKAFLKSPVIVSLFIVEAVLSMASSFSGTYILPYFEQIGGTPAGYGVFLLVATLVEIPFLLLGDRLQRRFGPRVMLAAVAALSTLRFLALFLMPSWGWFYAVVIPHASMIMRVFTMTVFVARAAPPELKTSAQMLYATVSGAFRALGAFAGGLAVTYAFGGAYRYNFLVSALLYAAAGVFLTVYVGKSFKSLDKTEKQV